MIPRPVVAVVADFVPDMDGRRSMEAFFLAQAEALRAAGWGVVHAFAGEPSATIAERLAALESPFLASRLKRNPGETDRLGRWLAGHRPRVIQTQFFSAFDPEVYRLRRASGAKSLVVVDQSSGVASARRGLKRLAARARGAVFGRRLDQVVAVSEFVRKRNVEQVHLPASKVRVVHNGIDVERFSRDSRDDRDRAGGDEFVIAFVGQLIPEKGVDLLLKAVHELGRDPGPCRLRVRVAGVGSQEAELRSYATENRLDCVEFLGRIDWIPRLFAGADVAVVPSAWDEAFAFTAAEALACGTPVVASDAGGIPEVVGDDGAAGLLFRRGDADGLRRALASLMADPARRRRMGEAARSRAVERFSIGRMVAGHVAAISDLA